MLKTTLSLTLVFFSGLTLSSCGGGGGGSGDGSSSGSTSGDTWNVKAYVTSDNCGERISDVQQNFGVSINGSSVTVDTSLVTMPGTKTGDGFTAAFQENNGDCLRTYSVEFSDMSSSTANVALSSASQCASVSCESKWAGQATR